jgi:PTS system fructose-specific IIA component
MILSDNLRTSSILLHTDAKNRWDIIKELVSLAVRSSLISDDNETDISQALIEREKSMSTGIGKGVAIPHCTIPYIDDIIILMATNEKGINFDSIDSNPVKIVIMLLVPKSKLTQHIKTLANIAKIMSDEQFKEQLLSFSDPEQCLSYITEYETKH